ncbi:MAG: hypothetical protein NTZ05_06290 [Chloroflexi bacterium]|nr:hypothetical protein [Chloroflexota bacterium]
MKQRQSGSTMLSAHLVRHEFPNSAANKRTHERPTGTSKLPGNGPQSDGAAEGDSRDINMPILVVGQRLPVAGRGSAAHFDTSNLAFRPAVARLVDKLLSGTISGRSAPSMIP